MFELANIRFDDAAAQAQAVAFLQANPDPGVRIRPQEQLDKAMETGQALALRKDGELCGLSLIYQFDTGPDGGVFFEMGTMRITQNGCGLQVFLAYFHLIQIWIEEYESEPPKVFAVVTPDTASKHNLNQKAKMALWTPDEPLATLRAEGGVPFAKEKEVLLAPPEAFSLAASELKKLHSVDRIFRTPKGDEAVRIGLEWFNPNVLAMIG